MFFKEQKGTKYLERRNFTMKASKTLLTLLVVAMVWTAMSLLPVLAQGQAGTTLEADVTCTGKWTRTFDWTIAKSVTPDTWNLSCGGSGTSQYTITVTKGQGVDDAWIEGQVCVYNGGERATEGLAISVELRNGVPPPDDLIATASVDVSSNPVLDPGERGCYDYHIDIPAAHIHAGGNYKVTANVTITNHSGYLGQPFGPSPSCTTILPTTPTLINDTIHVDDTNGDSWTFSDSGSVSYEKTFTCDGDKGTHDNTATIRETGQQATASVTINCEPCPPSGGIGGVKYYDLNANGKFDGGEQVIAGFQIKLRLIFPDGSEIEETQFTDENGEWSRSELPEGTKFTVCEVLPSGNWVQTGPLPGDTNITGEATANASKCWEGEVGTTFIRGLDFGNVCLNGGGGHTPGYWSNKNGFNTMNDGGTVEPELAMLRSLNLRNANGSNFDPTTYTQFRTWLLNGTATNMAYMLSVHLAAMALNVEAGFVDGSSLVYVSGIGFMSISDLMAAADAALGADGYTPEGDPNRARQEVLKNALDAANNNQNFVQPGPCPVLYP